MCAPHQECNGRNKIQRPRQLPQHDQETRELAQRGAKWTGFRLVRNHRSHNMSIATGTKLGRYEIRAKIGEGGMGEVYLAEDAQLHRKVALKILPAEVASDQDRMRRFVQEAQAAAALNHPNVAHIYEIGEHEGM